jgi:glycosyltransferase involved in cell wall biosynthesis
MNKPAVIHRHVNFDISTKWKYNRKSIKKIICVSEEVKSTMRKAIATDKIEVVHPGIEIDRFKDKKIFKENDGGKYIVGVVTALEKEKNVEEFISIAAELLTLRKDLQFIIVGTGSQQKKLETYICSLGLEQAIRLTGFQNDIENILPDLDVFLFTSVSEGFPLALLEAMAAKVPVVSTDSGGIRSMIKNGETGLLYGCGEKERAADHVLSLLNDTATAERMAGEAFQYVQQFDVPLMNKKIECIYSSVIN